MVVDMLPVFTKSAIVILLKFGSLFLVGITGLNEINLFVLISNLLFRTFPSWSIINKGILFVSKYTYE